MVNVQDIMRYGKCDSCPLNNKKKVPAEMNGTKIMLIGEAPGKHEEEIGKPFIGVSGSLLRRCIDVSHTYITNVVKCRPTLDNQDKDRQPSIEEISCCQPILCSEIENVKPDIIVTFGSVAMKWFHIYGSVIRNHGKMFRMHDVNIIVSLHPSYVNRKNLNGVVIYEDINEKIKEYIWR